MKNAPRFEAIIERLEAIVQELNGSLGLEESLKKYAEGMDLAKQAEERLKIIENSFQELTRTRAAPTAPESLDAADPPRDREAKI